MSEEEQKAIEYLNKYIKSDLFYEQEHYNKIKIVLNRIDKLQKENEELKGALERDIYARDCLAKHSISKDKIREKIKGLEEELQYEITKNEAKLQIDLLNQLLKEE